MAFARLGRYARTLRHLRGEQLVYLVLRRILRIPRAVPLPPPAVARIDAARDCCLPLEAPCWVGDRRFRFLNREREFGGSIDWRAEGESRLWQYNLHYFDWLRQTDCAHTTARVHMEDWLANNPPFTGTGWEPYPTALRLVNWAHALGAFPPTEVPQVIIDSIALQTAWLERNLEFHLAANHLFVNIKGLFFGAAVATGESGLRAARTAARLLARELTEQFLPDGGHYERSPMYHALLTQDLLELSSLAARNPTLMPWALRDQLQEVTRRALCFVHAMRTPDGSVLRFNDAVDGIAPRSAMLVLWAAQSGCRPAPVVEERECCALADSGYFLVREGDNLLAVDCGPIGPDHQPGHAHCDTLSFELFLAGRRLLANCGNYDYAVGKRRTYARSTRAHNSVEVDGVEQSEVWSAFRVGRRARPLTASLAHESGITRFEGAHDGYLHLPGRVIHQRAIEIRADYKVTVRDCLIGAGTHRAIAWFHFEPGLVLTDTTGGYRICDAAGIPLAYIDGIVADKAEISFTPRFPAFGQETTGPSLALRRKGTLPLRIECVIRPSTSRDTID